MFTLNLRVLVLFLLVNKIDLANILAIYPCPSISHQVVFRSLTKELIKRGHNVTVVTPDPMFGKNNAPDNLKEIDVHEKSYKIFKTHLGATVTGKASDLIDQVRMIKQLIPIVFQEQVKVKEFEELINNKTEVFDLILLEAYFTAALGVTHVFKAPTVLVSSLGPYIGNFELMGAPTHPLVYPNLFRQKLNNLTLWEKLNEAYNYIRMKYLTYTEEVKENKVLKGIFGPDIPPLDMLRNNVDMLLLNINPIWEGNFPVPPNVIYMGGLHQKPPKQLPEDLQTYMDNSNNGIVYVSFGTNVKPSLLPPEKIEIFHKVFSQLPYNVMWKWDDENLHVRSQNVKVFKWLPQPDLLRHPNVRLFITQGGLQSTDEAITAGVPLLGIPMLADQWYNVEKYIYHKIGVRVDFDNLNENLLKNSILEVAESESYRNNIVRLRSLMQDQPQKPLERAMWWLEYVLRHGGAKHLRAPAANMSWAEFLELELLGVILFSMILLTGVIVLSIRFLILKLLKMVWSNKKLKAF